MWRRQRKPEVSQDILQRFQEEPGRYHLLQYSSWALQRVKSAFWESILLGRPFHLGDIFYTLSSWDFNMKDPLLDQGAKAKTVSGHRANSGQQETGRGQFFSHVAPSLPQEALSLYSAHMLWVKDQDESPTQSLHPCLWHRLRHPPPIYQLLKAYPDRQKNVSVNQITLKEEDAGSLHPARGI